MKSFIVGLFTGAIATACFFIFSLRNKDAVNILPAINNIPDTAFHENKITKKDTTVLLTPIVNNIAATPFILRDSIVAFAKQLMGVPYLYGSTDPAKGFDCSGFITYVFNHFKIAVPRSSYDFENAGKKTDLANCNKGDLILFTGTNPQERTIGHIGIVIEKNNDKPTFIHSSSGKVNGVTITSMESVYYQGRFVSVVDVITK